MLKCQNLEHFDFAGWDIALFAAGSARQGLCAQGGRGGCVVIDNSSLYRMDPDVPLVVPEVNPEAIDGYRSATSSPTRTARQRRWWSRSSRCTTRRRSARGGQHLPVGLGRREGGDGRAVRAEPQHLRRRPAVPSKFTKQIAFNVIPHIDVFLDDGSTKEEWKMVVETKKILDPKIKVNATCVRVPVFVGHSRRSTSSSRTRSAPSRRRTSCARRRA
jgi:aspartate-semialdehyde dehydrogenase